jgi:hypothetical protein
VFLILCFVHGLHSSINIGDHLLGHPSWLQAGTTHSHTLYVEIE